MKLTPNQKRCLVTNCLNFSGLMVSTIVSSGEGVPNSCTVCCEGSLITCSSRYHRSYSEGMILCRTTQRSSGLMKAMFEDGVAHSGGTFPMSCLVYDGQASNVTAELQRLQGDVGEHSLTFPLQCIEGPENIQGSTIPHWWCVLHNAPHTGFVHSSNASWR